MMNLITEYSYSQQEFLGCQSVNYRAQGYLLFPFFSFTPHSCHNIRQPVKNKLSKEYSKEVVALIGKASHTHTLSCISPFPLSFLVCWRSVLASIDKKCAAPTQCVCKCQNYILFSLKFVHCFVCVHLDVCVPPHGSD